MKTLSLNILDIVQNSIRAKADDIFIGIRESLAEDIYQITIEDNGTGIPKEIFKNVTDPFFTTRTKRKMGLGLPLLKYHAELTGGGLGISSMQGNGTKITAWFSCSHIDRQPLGDITGVLVMLIAANPEINFSYCHSTDNGKYSFSTLETKKYLELDSLHGTDLLSDIKDMIKENIEEIEVSGVFQ
jgi:DNA mismatch repair ATPase MutL